MKYTIETQTQQGWQSPPQPLLAILKEPNAIARYPHVHVSGHFLSGKEILLIDKMYHRQRGVEVISPFVVDGSQQILLINRGWLEKDQIGNLKSKYNAKNVIDLTGIIDKIRSNPFILSRHEMGLTSWPAEQLQIHVDAIAEALKQPVYPFQLRLARDNPAALTSVWQPVNLPWHRHLGYAIQWALLALTSLIMLWVTNRKRKHERSTTNDIANNNAKSGANSDKTVS